MELPFRWVLSNGHPGPRGHLLVHVGMMRRRAIEAWMMRHRRVLSVAVVGIEVLRRELRVREVARVVRILVLLGGKFLCYLVNECGVFLLFSVEALREFAVHCLETLPHVFEH